MRSWKVWMGAAQTIRALGAMGWPTCPQSCEGHFDEVSVGNYVSCASSEALHCKHKILCERHRDERTDARGAPYVTKRFYKRRRFIWWSRRHTGRVPGRTTPGLAADAYASFFVRPCSSSRQPRLAAGCVPEVGLDQRTGTTLDACHPLGPRCVSKLTI
jgi:hypothetical protein